MKVTAFLAQILLAISAAALPLADPAVDNTLETRNDDRDTRSAQKCGDPWGPQC